jgi:Ca2+/Na+ antiporter
MIVNQQRAREANLATNFRTPSTNCKKGERTMALVCAIIGVAAIIGGVQTIRDGITITKNKKVTGIPAKALGLVLVLIGTIFLIIGVMGML